jgi:hypothetical protein
MSASFPNAKKTFSQLVDGTTYMEGTNVNTVYDEVEAIQTFIGAMGVIQSKTESVKNALKYYRRGCSVDYKTAADFYVQSGEIAMPDTSGNLCYRRNTAATTVVWGDIDVGGEQAGQTYYVYATGDSTATTFDVCFSTSAVSPYGKSFFQKIGGFFNDATSNITYVHNIPVPTCDKRVANAINTVYQALTDGIVYGSGSRTDSADILVYVDPFNPPTTAVQESHVELSGGTAVASYSVPVNRGDYYKVTPGNGNETGVVYFMPLGF